MFFLSQPICRPVGCSLKTIRIDTDVVVVVVTCHNENIFDISVPESAAVRLGSLHMALEPFVLVAGADAQLSVRVLSVRLFNFSHSVHVSFVVVGLGTLHLPMTLEKEVRQETWQQFLVAPFEAVDISCAAEARVCRSS